MLSRSRSSHVGNGFDEVNGGVGEGLDLVFAMQMA
jgi:hypothetical protein